MISDCRTQAGIEAIVQIKPLPLLKGIATNVFPQLSLVEFNRRDLDCDLARYSYSVWLRHLVKLHESGLPTEPRIVAELGPGKSLGFGICALLSGATRYYALDLVRYCGAPDVDMLWKISELFKNRKSIPDEREFPDLQPKLKSYEFPSQIFTEARLSATLKQERLQAVAAAIKSSCRHPEDGPAIQYFAPWNAAGIIKEETVDLLCSQFVLEHVDDLPETYRAMHRWLAPGGVMSHCVDFKSHAMTKDWNGHWTCSDRLWSLLRGKRPYMLNREPHSSHLKLLRQTGFEIVSDFTTRDFSGVKQDSLAAKFQDRLDAEDLSTSGALIQCLKTERQPDRPKLRVIANNSAHEGKSSAEWSNAGKNVQL